MKHMRYTALGKQERGIVSIVVTMLIMLIISLIVVAFARLSQREQRQALDRQLNTQAFYAAETAVNDVRQRLQTDPTLLGWDGTGQDCSAFIVRANLTAEKDINPGSGVAYTCLLVDPSPLVLKYDNIEPGRSEVLPLRSKVLGQRIDEVTFTWEPVDPDLSTRDQDSCPDKGEFPPAGAWPADCKNGILRVDLIPYDTPKTLDKMGDDTFTAFFQPIRTNNSPVSYPGGRGLSGTGPGATGQGQIIGGGCNDQEVCTVTIRNINSVLSYARLSTIYRGSTVTVSAKTGAGAAVELAGVQAVVDATGKANDVLRRISVHLPISATPSFPEYVLQANKSFCKMYYVADTEVTIDPSATIRRVPGDPASDYNFCGIE